MAELTRLQIDLSSDAVREIEELMAELGISTKKELFNNALTLLIWAIEEVKHGHKIASIDEASGKYRELQMPVLAAAARVARAYAREEAGAGAEVARKAGH